MMATMAETWLWTDEDVTAWLIASVTLQRS